MELLVQISSLSKSLNKPQRMGQEPTFLEPRIGCKRGYAHSSKTTCSTTVLYPLLWSVTLLHRYAQFLNCHSPNRCIPQGKMAHRFGNHHLALPSPTAWQIRGKQLLTIQFAFGAHLICRGREAGRILSQLALGMHSIAEASFSCFSFKPWKRANSSRLHHHVFP